MSDPIVVAIAADTNFSKQLAVVIASLSRVTGDRPHAVFVLHDGYTVELQAKVEQVAGTDVDLVWTDVSPSRAVTDALLPGHLPSATLYRLRLEELLPETIERVIYLDADTIVRRSLAPLWELDLDDRLAGGVRDAWINWSAQALPWRALGVSPQLPYFNCGVLLIPLGRWREHDVSAQALRLAGEYRFQDGDQGAINVTLDGAWWQLDPRWNVQSTHLDGDHVGVRAIEPPELLDEAARDPAIVHFHFGAWGRPWLPGCNHPFAHEWLDLLDTTAWAGWRPAPRSRFSKAAGRVRRAAGTLRHG
ncbi:MAG TPA: glycosyltransferase family 8 protein [Acidimicrobiia bacterium]